MPHLTIRYHPRPAPSHLNSSTFHQHPQTLCCIFPPSKSVQMEWQRQPCFICHQQPGFRRSSLSTTIRIQPNTLELLPYTPLPPFLLREMRLSCALGHNPQVPVRLPESRLCMYIDSATRYGGSSVTRGGIETQRSDSVGCSYVMHCSVLCAVTAGLSDGLGFPLVRIHKGS